jgi:hypothetical protein
MPSHQFKIGQTVVVREGSRDAAIPRGPYVINRLLPLVNNEPHYRVKNTMDGHERALLESQMQAVVLTPAPPEPPAPRKAIRARR